MGNPARPVAAKVTRCFEGGGFLCRGGVIRRAGAKKVDREGEKQFRTATRSMCAPAEVAQAVDGKGQHGEQPANQQAVGMVMADMLQAMAALGFVEAFILDLTHCTVYLVRFTRMLTPLRSTIFPYLHRRNAKTTGFTAPARFKSPNR